MSPASNHPDPRHVAPTAPPPPQSSSPPQPPQPTLGHNPADCIGPYKLLELLGVGGFGEVWLAERREPMVQRVALKIIKPGMDSRAVIARFEQERQALAVMDHPSVARVFDAGTTAPSMGSRPYFVMEHVAGEPITAYCDRHNLTIRQRLELFIPVCEAVQHAHHKGIIHRDLKPGNILVSVAGGRPIPKVIDFGVAKAVTHTFTQATVFTEQGQLIGTPEYMSPEQAEMGATDIDTRTDVYSLGVVLYELLTGLLPFDSASLRAAGYDTIRRIIREQEAVRPSRKLSTADDATAAEIARHRQAQREQLARELRRELDWIPLKALRKDRAERYETPADLARDLRNYLEARPLVAGPQSARYRLRKLVRRNRGPVAAAAAVAASLVLGMTGFAWQAHRIGIQRDRAVAAENTSNVAIGFMVKSLQSQDPNMQGEQGMAVAQAMSQAAHGIRDGDLKDQPSLEAVLLRTIAEILNGNGRSDEAEPLAERALALERSLHAGDHANVAASLRVLAGVLDSLGRPADAEPLYAQALEMQQRLHQGEDAGVAEALVNLALARTALGRAAEAEPLCKRALAIRRRLYPGDHREVANSLNNLAFVRQVSKGDAAAEPLYVEALAMRRRLYPAGNPSVAASLNNLASVRYALGRPSEAEPLLAQALEQYQRDFKGDHDTVAVALTNVAYIRMALNRAPEAEPLLVQALAMLQRLHDGDHRDTANTLKNLALCLAAEGHLPEALARARQAAGMATRILPESDPLRATCDETLARIRRQIEAESGSDAPAQPAASFRGGG